MAEPSNSPGVDPPKDKDNQPAREDTYTWQGWFKILRGQMSDEDMRRFKVDKDLRNEASDCKRCDEWKDYLFKYSMS